MKLVVVGQGRVGRALGAALGVDVISSRGPTALEADAFLIAVRDGAIADVARAILAQRPNAMLLHTAGGLPSSVLGVPEAAVLHPLVAFAGVAPDLRGALFAIEGDDAAVLFAEALVAKLGGNALHLTAAQMARYHAAAALASNHVLALVDAARELVESLGGTHDVAQSGIARLFGSVAHNLDTLGLPAALTGPIARGDVDMVRRHLDALPLSGDARSLYVATGLRLCSVALSQGAPAAEIASIVALLSVAALK